MLHTTPLQLMVSESELVGVLVHADESVGKEHVNSAWYYPEPKEKATNIKDHVAFCTLFSHLLPSQGFLLEIPGGICNVT